MTRFLKSLAALVALALVVPVLLGAAPDAGVPKFTKEEYPRVSGSTATLPLS